MGGKTGTAQKVPRSARKYLVSFIGFAPADNPQVVCYVVVDGPNADSPTTRASSAFAQEIFKNIMKEAMPYLNIPRNAEIPEDMKEEVAAEESARAEQEAEEEATEEETPIEEGTLVDPNTGETVKMPTEEEVEAEGDSGPLDDYESPILPEDGSNPAETE